MNVLQFCFFSFRFPPPSIGVDSKIESKKMQNYDGPHGFNYESSFTLFIYVFFLSIYLVSKHFIDAKSGFSYNT